jgi:hypothetical protein
MKLSELAAYYDHGKDEIVGAEEGSIAYLHEEGHKANKANFERFWNPLSGYLSIAMLYLLLVSNFWVVQLLGAAGFIVIMADEIHAWIYVFKKRVN